MSSLKLLSRKIISINYYPHFTHNDYETKDESKLITYLAYIPKNKSEREYEIEVWNLAFILNINKFIPYFNDYKDKNSSIDNILREIIEKITEKYTIHFIVDKINSKPIKDLKEKRIYNYTFDPKYYEECKSDISYITAFYRLNKIFNSVNLEIPIFTLNYENFTYDNLNDIYDKIYSCIIRNYKENFNNDIYITLGKDSVLQIDYSKFDPTSIKYYKKNSVNLGNDITKLLGLACLWYYTNDSNKGFNILKSDYEKLLNIEFFDEIRNDSPVEKLKEFTKKNIDYSLYLLQYFIFNKVFKL